MAVNEAAQASGMSAAALVQGKQPADSEATMARLTRLLAENSG